MGMMHPLARARGLGSAKDGVQHWYLQRASALLLALLTGWLIYAMVTLSGGGYEAAVAFMSKPWNTACAILLVISGFYHAMISVQVVIEDYIHAPALEWFLQFAVKALCYAGMVVSVTYLIRIATA
jgi:succinate dehydrogenase / fumarate reductase membrane anchor subunit